MDLLGLSLDIWLFEGNSPVDKCRGLVHSLVTAVHSTGVCEVVQELDPGHSQSTGFFQGAQ